MSIDFKEIVLNNYGGFKLKADIDENPEDIIAAVCYCDHGDDFLVVKTEDSCYEYGLFVTRNGWDARCLDDENHSNRNRLVKMPKLTGPFDYRSEMANKIYFLIRDYTIKRGGMYECDKIYVFSNKDAAQLNFDILCDLLKECYQTGIVFSDHAESHISDILKYLTANDILTDENMQKIEELKTCLRMNAIDGSAGKQENHGWVGGDDLHWIYYNGEKVTKKYHKRGIKVKSVWDSDEWGPNRGFCVNMDQFK